MAVLAPGRGRVRVLTFDSGAALPPEQRWGLCHAALVPSMHSPAEGPSVYFPGDVRARGRSTVVGAKQPRVLRGWGGGGLHIPLPDPRIQDCPPDCHFHGGSVKGAPSPNPLCALASCAGFLTGPWTVPSLSLRYIRRVIAACWTIASVSLVSGVCRCRSFPLPPLCDIPSGCCSFTGPWTVTRSSLRMLRWVAAFCRPLRPVLLLVSFPRSRSPVVGVSGLC